MQSAALSDSVDFFNTAEFACLEEACQFATDHLDSDRQLLSERVAERCVAIGEQLGLSGTDLVRLEVAAMVHRVGELFLSETLRDKSFLEMDGVEILIYRRYPVLSALRISQHVSREFYEIILNHREYYAGIGFLNVLRGEQIPLGARILCAATEYEELAMYHGQDPVRLDTIQRRMAKNAIGKYDPAVVDALMITIAGENVCH